MNAPRPDDARIARALADARQSVYWTDRPDRPAAGDPLEGTIRADLAIVGGGFTGLWAAAHAREADPGRAVGIVEGRAIGLRLRHLLEAVLTDPSQNTRARLLELLSSSPDSPGID